MEGTGMYSVNDDKYTMESDGAVAVPDKYKKMNYSEITAECERLSNKKATRKKSVEKSKPACKTKFII
jgi:hypothetical protein